MGVGDDIAVLGHDYSRALTIGGKDTAVLKRLDGDNGLGADIGYPLDGIPAVLLIKHVFDLRVVDYWNSE